MRIIVFFIVLCFWSCNSKTESSSADESNFIYEVLIEENVKLNKYFAEAIKEKIVENKQNEKIIKFDSATQSYLIYLTEIENEISKSTSMIFFEKNGYSQRGKEFVSKTNDYKTKIENLLISENLKKRINLILNTNDILYNEKGLSQNNESGKKELNKIYIKYLDYYYRGLPKVQSLALLANKKKNVLEIENEFIEIELRNQ